MPRVHSLLITIKKGRKEDVMTYYSCIWIDSNKQSASKYA